MISAEPAVMLVDSDPAGLALLEKELRSRLWYKIVAAEGSREAARLAQEHPIRVAVVEMDLQDGKAYTLVPRLKRIRPGLHAIVTSWDYSQEAERRSRACGLVLYMTQPLDIDILVAALTTAWRKSPVREAGLLAVG